MPKILKLDPNVCDGAASGVNDVHRPVQLVRVGNGDVRNEFNGRLLISRHGLLDWKGDGNWLHSGRGCERGNTQNRLHVGTIRPTAATQALTSKA